MFVSSHMSVECYWRAYIPYIPHSTQNISDNCEDVFVCVQRNLAFCFNYTNHSISVLCITQRKTLPDWRSYNFIDFSSTLLIQGGISIIQWIKNIAKIKLKPKHFNKFSLVEIHMVSASFFVPVYEFGPQTVSHKK